MHATEIQHDPSRGRRLVLAVITCLGPIRQHQIAAVAKHHYRLDEEQVGDRLIELVEAGLVESDETGRRWSLTNNQAREDKLR